MTPEELRNRTKQFFLRIVKLYQSLPKAYEVQLIGRHLLRSSYSIVENYRAACRARSRNEFFSKLSIVVEETDEVMLCLELLEDMKVFPISKLQGINAEAEELMKIMSSSRKTAKSANR